ncbi:MAG: DUF502 domain-containing protein, partial [Planctomycetales bacterium]|nr:DUF502 domain-containing protein [Planctomycetales bacterium]
QDPGVDEAGRHYVAADDGKWLPYDVYDRVKQDPGEEGFPRTARRVYRRYIEIRFLKWYVVGPVFTCGLILTLYLIGKFLAAGVGRILWNWFDGILHRVPIIRNVYGSVKQVTDFVFSEREIEFTRVVAVEYPRKGIWSLGFVTSESMLEIRSAANEPVLTVLMPTSPMPATGFTVNVKKSETIDLNITMDQAFQFIVSCGVVVPPHQMYNTLEQADKSAAPSGAVPGAENGALPSRTATPTASSD